MQFVKWVRKNNRKIMVFVVIFSMVSFVIGYTGIQIFFSLFGGTNPIVGTFEDVKIRGRDMLQAQNELKLLRMLGADRLLMAQGNQGLAGPLMVHLLFPDSQFTGDLGAQIKQAAQGGQLPVGIEQVEAFFSDRTQPDVTWILLNAESRKAGCVVSDEMSRSILREILPKLAQGADASLVINSIMSQTNLSEDQIIRTFANLLGVMFYAGNVTDSQAITLSQLQAAIGRSVEKMDAEYVEIPAGWFTDDASSVADTELAAQFETYKNTLPGAYTDTNPYGFGYKLPKRVQLEYMTVLLDDVKTQIEKPTAETMEEYYSRNIEQFRTEEPVDPNKPDGEKITKTRSFAEVLPQIRNSLEQERINRLANQIFNDAKSITEAGFAGISIEAADSAQLQAAAGDYAKAAADLTGRYKITVLTGQTGALSAAAFGQDSILRGLRLQQGNVAAPLSEIVYNIQPDVKEVRRRIGVPVMRLWENIGPMTGGYYDEAAGQYHRLMTMVRVVGIEEEAVPANMDVAFSVKGVVVHSSQAQDEQETTYSLAEQVASDVRLLKAMQTAKTRADSLAALVKERGWDEAVNAYNTEYAPNEGDSKVKVETSRQQMRLSKSDMDMARRYISTNPASASFIQTRLQTNALNEKLYAMLPEGSNTTGPIFEILEIKSKQACYVVKSVTVTRATEKDYLDNKMMTALRTNTNTSAELALIHFKPQNLFDRMGYVPRQAQVVESAAPIALPAPGEGL